MSQMYRRNKDCVLHDVRANQLSDPDRLEAGQAEEVLCFIEVSK